MLPTQKETTGKYTSLCPYDCNVDLTLLRLWRGRIVKEQFQFSVTVRFQEKHTKTKILFFLTKVPHPGPWRISLISPTAVKMLEQYVAWHQGCFSILMYLIFLCFIWRNKTTRVILDTLHLSSNLFCSKIKGYTKSLFKFPSGVSDNIHNKW